MEEPEVRYYTDFSIPEVALLQMMTGYLATQLIHLAAKLEIPDLLRAGPRSLDEIVRELQVDRQALHRVIRAMCTIGVLDEHEPGRYQLTPLSACLLGDSPMSLRGMALLHGEPWHWRCWEGLADCVRTGREAFQVTCGAPLFEYLARHPEAGEVFDAAMMGFTAPLTQFVLEAYDFSETGCVVDVGGGHGAMLIPLLSRYPRLRGILFDRIEVVEGARRALAAEGLLDRCQVVGGDFFSGVAAGGEVYLLKNVIHDWGRDEDALRILEQCHRAMPVGGRILLVEMVISPEPGAGFAKLVDVQMLVVGGGRERTEVEYCELLARAGFSYLRRVPLYPPFSILEGRK